jgi:uncharacterized protein YndB with AHSA1/START domain
MNPDLTIELHSDTEFVIERTFAAPKRLVYDCMTDPGHLAHWIGGGFADIIDIQSDLTIGGNWHWQFAMNGENLPRFFGQHLEIDAPNRFVRTFVYDVPGIREFPSVEVATLEDSGGGTTVKVLVRHYTKEARDGHLQSGMEDGLRQCYARLDEYLASGVLA